MREEIEKYINENYDILQEYPWDDFPNCTTFKHKDNKKWFSLIMDIPYERLKVKKDGIVDVINLKNIPELIGGLRREDSRGRHTTTSRNLIMLPIVHIQTNQVAK